MKPDYTNESPDYPPDSREERMKILMSIRDEDIDLSDMPETDFSQATRVGDRFWKIGERNLARQKAREKASQAVRQARESVPPARAASPVTS